MSTTGQHLKGLEGTLGDKDPVLALLTEISANLKELNSTLKSHTTRLARLEDPRPGDESSPKERLLEKTSGKDDKISGLHSSEDGSVPKGNVEIEPGGNTMARDIKAITPRAEPSHPYKVIKTIEVRPGEIAPREAFDDSWGKSGRLGYDKCFLSWLKEKDLAFAFDGRQSIPFDILSLSSYLSLEEAQHGLHSVEKLLRELESNGGLFLIRENSGVLWDEIHTFDLVKNRLIADIPAPEPSTFYEEIAGSSGIPSSRNNWKIKAPFRRLCVFGGVFRMPSVFPTYANVEWSMGLGVNGFSNDLNAHFALIQFAEFTVELEAGVPRPHPVFGWTRINPRTNFSLRFQFVWYEIVNSSDYESKRNSGNLYRDLNELKLQRKLQEQSCLVAAFWNRNSDLTVDSDDWTINLMLPVTLTGKAERFYEIDIFLESQGPAVFMKPLESVLPMLTKILFEIIPKLLRSWNSISEYIEQFVASKFTFLDEKEHDNLLFDDDTFSRSRQYSWVITSTDEFIPIILKTIEKYSEVKQWLINLHEEKEKDWTEAEEYGKQLHAIAERFKTQKDRAEALREGLFNASAVVESRLSTRLAQNVKLLTYVSIFYLPLAFCAALWAIPNVTDSSTRTPFIIAAVLMGFVTYMIVFNLDALVAFGWKTYNAIRKRCIQKMNEKPENKAWKEVAERFNRFEPDRGSDKPSEWYILLFCIFHPLRLLETSNSRTAPLEHESKEDVKIPKSQSWKRWFKLPRKKPKREDRKGKGTEGAVSSANPPESV